MRIAFRQCVRLQGDCVRSAAKRLVSPFAFAAEPVQSSAESGEARCGLCRRLEPPYVKATAYGSYDGGLRELIHLLKYNGVRPAANVLGRMLAEAMEDLHPYFAGTEILVAPVPLHARKLRQRGFNQSELIARCSLEVEVRGRSLPSEHKFAGTLPRNHVADRTVPPPAAGEYPRRIRGVQSRMNWLDAKSWSWTMSLRPAPRFQNARAFCAEPEHQKCM